MDTASPNSDVLDAATGNIFEGAPSFKLRHRAVRACWQIVWLLLARWSPPLRPFYIWRVLLLRAFGATVSMSARISSSVKVWYPPNLTVGDRSVIGPGVILYSMDRINVGRQAVVSQRAHLCCGSHDISDPNFQLTHKPIVIGDHAWLGAESFVGPGSTVGMGAVLAARGVTVKDLEPWTVYAGNPARPKRSRTHF